MFIVRELEDVARSVGAQHTRGTGIGCGAFRSYGARKFFLDPTSINIPSLQDGRPDVRWQFTKIGAIAFTTGSN